MKAALLPDRGVVKVAGEDARSFLHGLVSADILEVAPGAARFCALLRRRGKSSRISSSSKRRQHEGGGFFLDAPARCREGARRQTQSLQAALPGHGRGLVGNARRAGGLGRQAARPTFGLCLCRSAPAGAGLTGDAAAASRRRCGSGRSAPRWSRRANMTRTASRSAFRKAASISATATPSRTKPTWISSAASISPRAAMSARRWFRAWSIAASPARAPCRSATTGTAPAAGTAVTAGGRQVGTMGSAAAGHGHRARCASTGWPTRSSRGEALIAGGVPIRLVKPDWARFAFPGAAKAAE